MNAIKVLDWGLTWIELGRVELNTVEYGEMGRIAVPCTTTCPHLVEEYGQLAVAGDGQTPRLVCAQPPQAGRRRDTARGARGFHCKPLGH